jgi:hypothetical protein
LLPALSLSADAGIKRIISPVSVMIPTWDSGKGNHSSFLLLAFL